MLHFARVGRSLPRQRARCSLSRVRPHVSSSQALATWLSRYGFALQFYLRYAVSGSLDVQDRRRDCGLQGIGSPIEKQLHAGRMASDRCIGASAASERIGSIKDVLVRQRRRGYDYGKSVVGHLNSFITLWNTGQQFDEYLAHDFAGSSAYFRAVRMCLFGCPGTVVLSAGLLLVVLNYTIATRPSEGRPEGPQVASLGAGSQAGAWERGEADNPLPYARNRPFCNLATIMVSSPRVETPVAAEPSIARGNDEFGRATPSDIPLFQGTLRCNPPPPVVIF